MRLVVAAGPYSHAESKQLLSYLSQPLDEIEACEADAKAAKEAEAKGEPYRRKHWRMPKTSHTDHWPRTMLDQFHLDTIHPTETEAGTWLFGGPVMDYAVTNDRDALQALIRELRTQKGSKLGGATADDDDEGAVKWVQCEKSGCLKWRKLPSWLRDDELPEKFTCDQNKWNPDKASCSAPEEDYTEEVTVTWSLGDMVKSLQVCSPPDPHTCSECAGSVIGLRDSRVMMWTPTARSTHAGRRQRWSRCRRRPSWCD